MQNDLDIELRDLLKEYPYLDLCFLSPDGKELNLLECYFEYTREDETEAKLIVQLRDK